jgi:hypothetical protein
MKAAIIIIFLIIVFLSFLQPQTCIRGRCLSPWWRPPQLQFAASNDTITLPAPLPGCGQEASSCSEDL